MIFATVGNANQSFERLLSAVDKLAREGIFGNELVILQTGNAVAKKRYAQSQAFFSMEAFERHARDARLVICHGGCTVLQLLRWGKRPVVMPRQRKYAEHINDHQLSFVRALAAEGYVVPAYEVKDLLGAILHAETVPPRALPPSRMKALIESALEEFVPKPLDLTRNG